MRVIVISAHTQCTERPYLLSAHTQCTERPYLLSYTPTFCIPTLMASTFTQT